eukprot:SAG11_NODE_3343_length_2511_cov_1.277778_4_plen_83_part_01
MAAQVAALTGIVQTQATAAAGAAVDAGVEAGGGRADPANDQNSENAVSGRSRPAAQVPVGLVDQGFRPFVGVAKIFAQFDTV